MTLARRPKDVTPHKPCHVASRTSLPSVASLKPALITRANLQGQPKDGITCNKPLHVIPFDDWRSGPIIHLATAKPYPNHIAMLLMAIKCWHMISTMCTSLPGPLLHHLLSAAHGISSAPSYQTHYTKSDTNIALHQMHETGEATGWPNGCACTEL